MTITTPFLCQFVDRIKEQPTDLPDIRSLVIQRIKSDPSKYKLSKKKALILTRRFDPEADMIALRLLGRGVDCMRLNVEDVPQGILISASNNHNLKSKCRLTVRKQAIDTSAISVVFLRHFDIDEVDFDGDELARKFSLQQWQDAFQILRSNLACKWINDAAAAIQANDRARQLSLARAAGFEVPQTTITNDPRTAREFLRSHSGNVVIKALRHHGVEIRDRMYLMHTRRLADLDLRKLGDLVHAPCILQEMVAKKSELRVTVVDDKVFVAKLNLQSERARQEDIHRCPSTDISIEPFEMDKLTSQRCVKLMKELGLVYGAMDFIVDKNDRLIFLEVNAAGDWYWIENRTKDRITKAVADQVENAHDSNGNV